MKVVKKTGMVPVRFLRNGEIRGVVPEKIPALLEAGVVEMVEIPDDVETIEVDFAMPRKKPETSGVMTTRASGEVQIPDNWKELHHLQAVKLAKEILGTEKFDPPAEKRPAEYALEVIGNEVARRAEANSKT